MGVNDPLVSAGIFGPFHELSILSVQILSLCHFCGPVHKDLACRHLYPWSKYRSDLYERQHKSDKVHMCQYLDNKNEQSMKRKKKFGGPKIPALT